MQLGCELLDLKDVFLLEFCQVGLESGCRLLQSSVGLQLNLSLLLAGCE